MYPLTRLNAIRTLDEAERLHAARVSDAKWVWEKYKDNFKRRSCPVCGGAIYESIKSFHGTFGVELCVRCNSPFVNPVPSQEALEDFYANGVSNKIINELYKKRAKKDSNFVLDTRTEQLFQIIKQFSPDQEIYILEVGCNQGTFLSRVRMGLKKILPEYKVKMFGVDIDKSALIMNTDPNLELIHGWAESLCRQSEWCERFDIVCHFELIEHLLDPTTFMQSLRLLMKPGAFMQLTTPNLEGMEIAVSNYNDYRLMAHTIVPPLHLNSFSILNFMHFALRTGYNVLEIETPGKLDVDCVSLYCQHSSKMDLPVEPVFRYIETLDDETKGWLQALISRLKGSSTLRVVLRKPTEK